MTTIAHRSSERGGRFTLLDGDREVGELDYVWKASGVMHVQHTGVRQTHTGRGLARDLVDAAALYARSGSHRITTTCWYARKVLAAADYADVRA